jgi:hypothetical protein
MSLSDAQYSELLYLVNLALRRAGGVLGNVSGHGGILWKPAGGGDARTWADVMKFVNATECPFPIWLEGNGAFPATDLVIPPAVTPYVLHECWFQAPLGSPTGNIVDVQDGAQLLNLGKISGGLGIFGSPTAAPCLLYTVGPNNVYVLVAEDGAVFGNGGTRALVDVVNAGGNVTVVFASKSEGGFVGVGGPAPLFALAPGSNLLTILFGPAGSIATNYLTGDNTTTLNVGHVDGATWDYTGGPFSPGVGFGHLGPGFTGNIVNQAQTVVGGSGPSGFRPQGSPIIVGTSYYQTDATAGLTPGSIWWNGVAWVDSAGTPV